MTTVFVFTNVVLAVQLLIKLAQREYSCFANNIQGMKVKLGRHEAKQFPIKLVCVQKSPTDRQVAHLVTFVTYCISLMKIITSILQSSFRSDQLIVNEGKGQLHETVPGQFLKVKVLVCGHYETVIKVHPIHLCLES